VNDAPVVAIVDDDDSVRRSLLRVVRSAGYPAEGFASAREFLEWLRRGRAACLLLDVHMSEMSGFELQDRLAIPVIFITAHDDAKTQERIAKSGAAGHLRKPCEEQTVLDAIRRAVWTSDDPLRRQCGAAGSGTRPVPNDLDPTCRTLD
jgi:FixJ family two-component response regulator